jgi:hypothetical protein
MIKLRAFVRPSKITHGFWLSCAVLGVFVLCTAAGNSEPKLIITWGGNTPQWNQKLHLNAIRIGCSDAPAGCVEAANKIAREQHVSKIFLAVPLSPSAISYGQQYSALSLANPGIYSVGYDDFVSQMERLHTSTGNVASMLNQFVSGLKQANLNLRFGVTVYENELSVPGLTSSALASVRNRTDFVHLYIHYRQDGPDFATSVQQAKALFPNAQIIAGVYAVDRIDYLPCSKGARVPCTGAQEVSLFRKTFDVQLQLMREGSVAGLEFYPGDFGEIAKAGMWRDPRSCRPGRLPECIATSQQMRDYVGEELSRANL